MFSGKMEGKMQVYLVKLFGSSVEAVGCGYRTQKYKKCNFRWRGEFSMKMRIYSFYKT